MGMQTFTGKIIGAPRMLKTTKNQRTVVHVNVSFLPEIDINGKLPKFEEGAINSVNLSFWDEGFQAQIMANPDALIGKMITGLCDHIEKRDQYYNGTGYAFVLDPKGKVKAPIQVITQSSAPTAPVAPV